MVTVAEDSSAGGVQWRRKLLGGSGVSPLGAGDPVTGLYYERARWYSASLGTWISQDPLQCINGANTYQFVGDGPVGSQDPNGLAMIPLGPPWTPPDVPPGISTWGGLVLYGPGQAPPPPPPPPSPANCSELETEAVNNIANIYLENARIAELKSELQSSPQSCSDKKSDINLEIKEAEISAANDASQAIVLINQMIEQGCYDESGPPTLPSLQSPLPAPVVPFVSPLTPLPTTGTNGNTTVSGDTDVYSPGDYGAQDDEVIDPLLDF